MYSTTARNHFVIAQEKGREEKNFPPTPPYPRTRACVGEKEGRKEIRARERGFTRDGREIRCAREKRER